MDGRGHNADGTVGFNALGIFLFNSATKTCTMHSFAEGYAGDFVLRPTPDGFVWDIPAGPAAGPIPMK